MNEQVIQIISSMSGLSAEELTAGMDADRAWDSFTHVEIIIELENSFSITFDEAELAEMSSLRKIIDIIEKKMQR